MIFELQICLMTRTKGFCHGAGVQVAYRTSYSVGVISQRTEMILFSYMLALPFLVFWRLGLEEPSLLHPKNKALARAGQGCRRKRSTCCDAKTVTNSLAEVKTIYDSLEQKSTRERLSETVNLSLGCATWEKKG